MTSSSCMYVPVYAPYVVIIPADQEAGTWVSLHRLALLYFGLAEDTATCL